MIFYIIFFQSFLLVLVIYIVFYMMCYSLNKDVESMSPYECGFDPNSFTRLSFSYRFFLVSILFVIFDVEISLMLPIPFLVMSMLGQWIFLIFIGILIGGLLYEYNYGSLDWLDNIVSKA